MRQTYSALVLGVVLGLVNIVSGLGTSCSVPLGPGTAAAADPYWLQTIKHQGTAAFNANPSSYKVFRNVKVIWPLASESQSLITPRISELGETVSLMIP